MEDNGFRVTVYAQKGYFYLCDLQAELRAAGIEAGITCGGLSVWGEWEQYEKFAEIAGKYDCTWKSGGSVHYQRAIDAFKNGGYPEELAAKEGIES